MTVFRYHLPRVFSLLNPAAISLFYWIVFLYFLVSSTDTLNIRIASFNVKLTNFVSVLYFFIPFLALKRMIFSKSFSTIALIILGCMCVSAINSPYFAFCISFLFFFLFNYILYFCFSYNLCVSFSSRAVLKVYFLSFYCMGTYALLQVLVSMGGVVLPGADQYIFGVSRGQGFSYEPSFYALYMTPFAMYYTARFFFQNRKERRLWEVVCPNVMLLASTSTGCFFSYVFFLLFFALFRLLGVLDFVQISVKKLILAFAACWSVLIGTLWCLKRDLIISGLLKFFYSGIGHFSIQDRWRGITDYWDLFLENPLFGVGFGAGPCCIVEKRFGIVDAWDRSQWEKLSAMNVTTEILAGVGLIGFIAFLLFLFGLVKIFYATVKLKTLSESDRISFLAFALSICVMFATLQFNQSIMRCYMWIHVGLFCGYAKYLQTSYRLHADAQLPLGRKL